MYSNQSYGDKKGTAYRQVIGRIVDFANREIKELYPCLDYMERIKIAHEEPFFTAAKELRNLSRQERLNLGLGQ